MNVPSSLVKYNIIPTNWIENDWIIYWKILLCSYIKELYLF